MLVGREQGGYIGICYGAPIPLVCLHRTSPVYGCSVEYSWFPPEPQIQVVFKHVTSRVISFNFSSDWGPKVEVAQISLGL